MKRLWAVGALAIVVAVLCVSGTITTDRLTGRMAQTLSQAKSAAEGGNQSAAIDLSRQAEEDWQKDHMILCTFIPHARLEAIDQTLAGLPPLIQHGTIDEFSAECARGVRQVQSLKEAELPLLENIL